MRSSYLRRLACRRGAQRGQDLLCFHLVVLLLQRVDLVADQLNLLDVARDCEPWLAMGADACGGRAAALTLALVVDAALRLGLELGADAVEQLVQALAGAALGTAHDAGRVVVHGGGRRARRRHGERRAVCAVSSATG